MIEIFDARILDKPDYLVSSLKMPASEDQTYSDQFSSVLLIKPFF